MMEWAFIGVAALVLWRWWRRQRDQGPVVRYQGPAVRDPQPAVFDRWPALLERDDVLIIDTETTGLNATAEVVEVGVIDTTGRERFHALVMPVGRISRDASDIHGLTRDVLKGGGAKPWPHIHEDLLNVLCGASCVLAWNADFDQRLLEQSADRHGLALPDLPWRDLLADYRQMRGVWDGNSLDAALARANGKREGAAHRALSDCRAILAVLKGGTP